MSESDARARPTWQHLSWRSEVGGAVATHLNKLDPAFSSSFVFADTLVLYCRREEKN